MRICVLTQGVTPHQIPLARRLASMVGEENFLFVGIGGENKERAQLGWGKYNYKWIREPTQKQFQQHEVNEWISTAEVLLSSIRDVELFRKRCSSGLLTFYTSERWFKPPLGKLRLLHPLFFKTAYDFRHLLVSNHFHYLAIGVYAAKDMRGIAPNNVDFWKWGYFVETSKSKEVKNKVHNLESRPLKLLWVGRYIKLKKAESALKAFSDFLKTNRQGTLMLVGTGNLEQQLKNMTCRLELKGEVSFLPPMSTEEVREKMRMADVLLFTSNGYEGWGAVVCEGLEEGCVVVATEESGAGKTLISHGHNGLLFRCDDVSSLVSSLCNLYDNIQTRYDLANNGLKTMHTTWGVDVAAERFISIATALVNGQKLPVYKDGPMSLGNRV